MLSPADLIEPQLEKFEKDRCTEYQRREGKRIVICALFPAVATEFFNYRQAQQTKVDPNAADTESKSYV